MTGTAADSPSPDPAAEPARHPHQAGVVKMLI
jgi:hypothetical protein